VLDHSCQPCAHHTAIKLPSKPFLCFPHLVSAIPNTHAHHTAIKLPSKPFLHFSCLVSAVPNTPAHHTTIKLPSKPFLCFPHLVSAVPNTPAHQTDIRLASNTSHSLSNMIPTSPTGSSSLPAAIPLPHLVNTSLLCLLTVLVCFCLSHQFPTPCQHLPAASIHHSCSLPAAIPFPPPDLSSSVYSLCSCSSSVQPILPPSHG
jgi:hypothetical protein